jgi:hypothetical protein
MAAINIALHEHYTWPQKRAAVEYIAWYVLCGVEAAIVMAGVFMGVIYALR